MANLTLDNLFDKAMDATASGIKDPGFSSSDPWKKLIPRLQKLVTDTFNPAEHHALDDLRKAAEDAGREGRFLAAGAAVAKDATGAGVATAAETSRCACLKLLRHTYYYAKRGNHKMWIVSLPRSYSEWPHKYLKCTHQQLVERLAVQHEQFNRTHRKHISEATQRGLHWIHKAEILLDDVGPRSRGMRLLKRWFGDEDTTEDQLKTFAKGKLIDGLKKMAPKMSAGHLVVTDFVPIRHSADAGDQGFAAANAFVWADKRDVVYVEKAFFKHDAASVFQNDERHWARIMVHEMSHREAKTDDKKYGWAGIKPKKASFSSATAMVNADSWALFVANAAGAMTQTDVSRALAGT